MEPKSYSRYILTILCASVVFTTIVLIALNAWTNEQNRTTLSKLTVNSLTDSEKINSAFTSGYNAARERLKANGLYTGPIDPNSLRGIVISVNPDNIVVRQNNLDADPRADGVPNEREIMISKNTKIYSESQKQDEKFVKEIIEFGSKVNSDQVAPSPMEQKEITLSEIPVGSIIQVTSNVPVQFLLEIPAVSVSIVEPK
jgi:hypothetical protein